jgi:hypothetical protein
MEKKDQIKRSWINPIEVAVFGVIGFIFFRSAYSLFFDWGHITSVSADILNQKRKPASITEVSQIELNCYRNEPIRTSLSEVSLKSMLCSASIDETMPVKSLNIKNRTTEDELKITLFLQEKRYESEPFQLKAGENSLDLFMEFEDGSSHSERISIHRQPASF